MMAILLARSPELLLAGRRSEAPVAPAVTVPPGGFANIMR
jgi:hypothetical protein